VTSCHVPEKYTPSTPEEFYVRLLDKLRAVNREMQASTVVSRRGVCTMSANVAKELPANS